MTEHRLFVVPGIALALLSVVAVAHGSTPTPAPFTVPPPDITALVPFAAPPFEKPAVTLVDAAVPAMTIETPTVPAIPVTMPPTPRPAAALGADVPAGCDTATGSASDLLACGQARVKKGDHAGAVQALQGAIKAATSRDAATKDRDLLIRSRYWLGEALMRVGKHQEADAAFRQAAAERSGHEYEVLSAHAAGWTALRLDDHARARDLFKRVLAGTVPPVIDGWARHGLALSLYAAGQFAEAAQAWADLSKRTIPADLVPDVAFWYGDTLGRVGDFARAEQNLKTFVAGARPGTLREHPMYAVGLVRLGWWAFAAGRSKDAVTTLRTCFAGPCGRAPKIEQDLAGAGLALALGASGDWNYGRTTARWLGERKSPLAAPISLRMMRVALDAKNAPEALAMAQEVLASQITKPVRAWILMTKGEVLRQAGDRDEARTQYDLAAKMDPGSDVGVYAAYRLAQSDFEMREYAAAAAGLDVVNRAKVAPDLRAGALLLQGESAYRAGNQTIATQAFKRVLAEFPKDPQAAVVQLSLAWSAFRQGQKDEARTLFAAYAAARPNDAHTADALTLAAQITLDGGDFKAARQQFDHVIAKYPSRPGTDFARLNRAILMVRTGQHADATTALRELIAKTTFQHRRGHAHAALGAALLAAKQPADAAREFAAAQKDGGPRAYAQLGTAVVAMHDKRVDDAARALAEARKDGGAEMVATADYGLAAVALERGRLKPFKTVALEALTKSPPAAPRFLYVLTGIALEDKDLTGALDTAKKLAQQFPNDEVGDDALERVGAAATKAQNWPVVYEAYTLMRQRYASSPFIAGSARVLAEAAFQTNRTPDARRELTQVVAVAPKDGRAWIMLAQAHNTGGDRMAALEAFERAAKEADASEWTPALVLDHARLLAGAKRWSQARALFQRLLKSNDPAVVLESTYAIGDTYRGEDNLTAAAQFFMTAAYLAPESPVGRRSLLAAGQAFSALKQPESAANVYRQLLAQSNVPGELATAAKQGLEAVKGSEKQTVDR